MRRSKFTDEQILASVREGEAWRMEGDRSQSPYAGSAGDRTTPAGTFNPCASVATNHGRDAR